MMDESEIIFQLPLPNKLSERSHVFPSTSRYFQPLATFRYDVSIHGWSAFAQGDAKFR